MRLEARYLADRVTHRALQLEGNVGLVAQHEHDVVPPESVE